jgi:hypothetical protein
VPSSRGPPGPERVEVSHHPGVRDGRPASARLVTAQRSSMIRLKVRALPVGHPAGKNPVIGAASAKGSQF